MDDRTIARWRLDTHRLAGTRRRGAVDVVRGFLGVQAENHPQAAWAVATRTVDTTPAGVDTARDRGGILRTHVLRPTWHFVVPDDLRWLLDLTAPRVRRSLVQVQRDTGLSDAHLDQAATHLAALLSGGVALTRDQVGERLRAHGLPADGMALGAILTHVELAALVCSGPSSDGEHTYALLDERAPGARRLDRDEALAELALRYMSGHGPATDRDLAYWASMTLTDVRAGLEAVRGELDTLEHDGRTYWFRDPPRDLGPPVPRAHLLQNLDELHNGYQDSRYVLDADRIVPRGRSATVGMVVVDGQMVGGMRRTLRSETVVFDLDLYRDLDAGERAAVQDAADRYGQWLGLRPEVHANR